MHLFSIRKASFVVAVAATIALIGSGSAQAQQPKPSSRPVPLPSERSDTEKSDELFREGRTLMDAGDFVHACPKFEESLRLSQRIGTMLNLGGCYERRGQLARALRIYERAATLAREATRPEREQVARELAAAIEPKLAKLALVIEAAPDGLIVDVDGEPLPLDPSVAVPIDPGSRVLRARGPGKKTFTMALQAVAGATVHATIPILTDDAAVTSPPPPSSTTTTTPAAEIGSGASSSPWRTVGIASGLTIGAVGIVGGTIFGLRAKSKHDDSEAYCQPAGCNQDGIALIDEAKTAGNVSTIAFVAGGLGLAIAAVCWFAWPGKPNAPRSKASSAIVPRSLSLSPTTGGFGGSFD